MSKKSFKGPFPPEILLEIFSAFSLVEWGIDGIDHPWNPFCVGFAQIDRFNRANIATKHSLSLVSKQFNVLTKKLLYEYVCIRDAYPSGSGRSKENTLKSFFDSVELYTKRLDIIRHPKRRYDRDGKLLLFPQAPEPGSRETLFHLAHELLWKIGPWKLEHLRVALPSYPFKWDPSLPDYCSKLKVFSWEFEPLFDARKFIGYYASNLHVLDLTSDSDEESRIYFANTEFPNLHTLRLSNSKMMRTFLKLELPSLRVADIGVTYIDPYNAYPFPDEKAIFVAFVEKYGRNLTILALRDFSDRLTGAIGLDALPNLCELALLTDKLDLKWLKEDVVLKITRFSLIGSIMAVNEDADVLLKCQWISDKVSGQLSGLKSVLFMESNLDYGLEDETVFEMERILGQVNVELEWML